MSFILWGKRILTGVASLVGIALVSGSIYEHVSRHRAARDFPPVGVMVDVGGGRRIQLDCRGAGSPTVVLESGLDNYGSLAWAAVHDSIAQTTRVCAYSRPGIMWSDPTVGPFDSRALAHDLHLALVTAGESAPWVMVGHSIGGPYVMMFTNLYDAEVVGMVLVDPSHPDQFARYREVVGKSIEPPAVIFRVGASLAWTGLVRLLPSGAGGTWPASVARITPAFLPLSVDEMAKEVEAVPATLAATTTFRSLGDRPLVVLTAMIGQPASQLRMMRLTVAQGGELQVATQALHKEEATWSSQGRQELVAGASHYIHFDRPEVVTAAIRDVVREVRAKSSSQR